VANQLRALAHGFGFRNNTAQIRSVVWYLTYRRSGLRDSLVTALVSCADTPTKPLARRFLRGLSADELQFIAEYYGACILEAPRACVCDRAALAARIAAFQRARGNTTRMADVEHKMILLLEYLCSVGQAVTA
jgi:hypothetical protein